MTQEITYATLELRRRNNGQVFVLVHNSWDTNYLRTKSGSRKALATFEGKDLDRHHVVDLEEGRYEITPAKITMAGLWGLTYVDPTEKRWLKTRVWFRNAIATVKEFFNV